LEALPFEVLLRELRQRDPAAYEKMDRQNPRRVIRALEVIRLTGKKFSEQRAAWQVRSSRCGDRTARRAVPTIFYLGRTSQDLHARIDARVDKMFSWGLVEETRALLERGLEQNQTAMQAIGYRQVVDHLRGERSLADTIELVKIRTRQFAKRQLTWFRRQFISEWMELKPGESPEMSAQKIRKRV